MNLSYERARAGDVRATRAITDSLHPRICKMAAYYARCSGEDADDLLQEAWVGLLEALPALDVRIGSPEQYLIQRARWRLLDSIKRARVRRCVPLEDAEAVVASPGDGNAAMAGACAAEFAGRLKPVQRAVLGMLVDGLTWREAGAALGCTSANIAYHVRQIRREYLAWCDSE